MDRIEKKIKVDDVERSFVLRKPKYIDTLDAMEKGQVTLDPQTGRPRGSAGQMMRVAAYRVAKCVVTPEEYRDAGKLMELPEGTVQELISALDEITNVPANFKAPSDAPSEPGA